MATIAHVEITDTFGGDANYSWVERATFHCEDDVSDLAVMRRAKAAIGWSGLRGRTSNFGDGFEFRPYGMCAVMFVTFEY
jgi:hypothetical protein